MKICTTCKLPKSLTEFNKNRCRKDGYQTFCRDCGKIRSKRYYSENRENHIKVTISRKREIVKANQQLLCEYLCTHPCVDCGEKDIIALDFDHLRDKRDNISSILGDGHSWNTIVAEIAKCEVVCANCHRRREASRTQSYRLAYQE